MRRKTRRCAFCGRRLRKLELRLCSDCVRDPLLMHVFGKCGEINSAGLRILAVKRSQVGKPPLEGFSLEEVNALAREYEGTAYGSYGKLRGYVDATGKLPPERG